MFYSYWMIVILLFSFVQPDNDQNLESMSHNLRKPSEIKNIAVVCRHTYATKRPGKSTSSSQFFRYEIVDLGQFVKHSTDILGPGETVPEKFEFTGFFNTQYASGLRNSGSDYSMINMSPITKLTALGSNYLSLMYFPLDQDVSFDSFFELSNVEIDSFNTNEAGDTAVVVFRMNGSQDKCVATFDLSRQVCVKQVWHSPKQTRTVDVKFEKGSQTFPTSIALEIKDNSNHAVTLVTDQYIKFEEGIQISPNATYLSHYGLPEPDFLKPKSYWVRIAGAVGVVVFIVGFAFVFRRK